MENVKKYVYTYIMHALPFDKKAFVSHLEILNFAISRQASGGWGIFWELFEGQSEFYETRKRKREKAREREENPLF